MEPVYRPPIFENHPQLEGDWVQLIDQPTPILRLENFGRHLGHGQIYIKREDLTAPGYGGNKVRNLEFLLGRARANKVSGVATLAPLGSNFVAAMAAQAHRVGLKASIFHFVPEFNDQIERHAKLSEKFGAELIIQSGPVFPSIVAGIMGLAMKRTFHRNVMRLPTGGSNAWGALGHVNAALELAAQIRSGELPEPDVLLVGAGTCGTMAGLLVGLKLAGLSTRVVGVRCVDRVICNRHRIAHLANSTARLLKVNIRVKASEVALYDYTHFESDRVTQQVHYGRPLAGAAKLIAEMNSLEGIQLDTTYTTKVIHFFKGWISRDGGELARSKILYWHTFSPAALKPNLSLRSPGAPEPGVVNPVLAV